MGFHKAFKGLSELPEIKEFTTVLLARNYSLEWCDDSGLKMTNGYTEIYFHPESDRLRVCIHDDGMGIKETAEALKIAETIFLKYGYKKGENILDDDNSYKETNDELYKYF